MKDNVYSGIEETDDTELIRLIGAAKKGDQSAFDRLAEAYRPLIDSAAGSFSRTCGIETDDLRQEALLAFYGALLSFDESQNKVTFGLYAKICLRNRLVSAQRKAKRRARSAASCEKDETQTNEKTERRILWKERRAELELLLSPFEKKVLSLCVAGNSYKEIAQKLGKDTKSVDNAVQRIKRKTKTIT